MMIDPSAVVSGVAAGYLTQKGIEKTNEVLHPDQYSPQHEMVNLLQDIKEILAPAPKDAIEESMNLFPYPGEYIIQDNFHERAHVCILFYTATPVRFDGIFGGSMLKTVGPGWIQVDQPGRLSTTDAQNHFVTISYRDDALGGSF
jgi:hypothetical protein